MMRLSLAAGTAALFLASNAAAATILVDFEDTLPPGNTSSQSLPNGNYSSNGMVFGNLYMAQHKAALNPIDANPGLAADGTYYSSTLVSVISAGALRFKLTGFDLASMTGGDENFIIQINYFNPNKASLYIDATLGGGAFSHFSFADQPAISSFSVYSAAGPMTNLAAFAIDNVEFENLYGAIPEPATWAMMIVGFLGTGQVLRSSRRKAIPA